MHIALKKKSAKINKIYTCIHTSEMKSVNVENQNLE